MLKSGIYEKVINTETAKALSSIPDERKATSPVDTAETAAVLTKYVTEEIRHSLEDLGESETDKQVALVNNIINMLGRNCCIRQV